MKFDYKALLRWVGFVVVLVAVWYLTNILTYETQRVIINGLIWFLVLGMVNTIIDSVFGINIYKTIKEKVVGKPPVIQQNDENKKD